MTHGSRCSDEADRSPQDSSGSSCRCAAIWCRAGVRIHPAPSPELPRRSSPTAVRPAAAGRCGDRVVRRRAGQPRTSGNDGLARVPSWSWNGRISTPDFRNTPLWARVAGRADLAGYFGATVGACAVRLASNRRLPRSPSRPRSSSASRPRPCLPCPTTPARRQAFLRSTFRAAVAELAARLVRITNLKLVNPQRLDRLSPPASRLDTGAQELRRLDFRTRWPMPTRSPTCAAQLALADPPKKGLITDLDDIALKRDRRRRRAGWDFLASRPAWGHRHGLYQQML